MKTYIVYFNGIEVGMIQAANHNAAEKKAQEKADYVNKNNPPYLPKVQASVAYTEI